jgi:hypothetical protein
VRLVDWTKPFDDGSIDEPKIAAVRNQMRPADTPSNDSTPAAAAHGFFRLRRTPTTTSS